MGQNQPGTRYGERGLSGGRDRLKRRGGGAVTDSVRIADDRRRDLLRYLATESPATVDEAAEQIAAWDQKEEPESVADDQRERVREDLLRNHLPRLRACGLVEFDETARTVALTESGDAIVTDGGQHS